MSLRCPLVIALAFFGGCKADLPKLTDANKSLDVRCTSPNADTLIDVFPTTLANASSVLGAPDALVVTLLQDNVVTVGFLGLGGVTDAQGNDLHITAMADANAQALVRVAGSDMDFVYTGTLTQAASDFDIAVAQKTSVLYVRLLAVGGTVRVDALTATHDMCR